MAQALDLATFRREIDSAFRVRQVDGSVVVLVLVEAADRRSNPRQEQFAILFRGPREPRLEQQNYAMEHDRIGAFDLFLVPVGQDERGFSYEAVFNRTR